MKLILPYAIRVVGALIFNASNAIAQNVATEDGGAINSKIGMPPLVQEQSLAQLSDLTLRNKPENDEINLIKTPLSIDEKKGIFGASKLTLQFRNYSEYLEIKDYPSRTAWVQGVQGKFESGVTPGYIGIGFNLTPFLAAKINGGQGARNMVHVGKNPDDANRKIWGYLGEYAIKAQTPVMLIKYGLQNISNPFLHPYDTRALPPTFRGLTGVATPMKSIAIQAGSVDAVNSRGTTYLQKLATSYGGIPFDRLTYIGVDWDNNEDKKISIYSNQAKDLWNQYYVSAAKSTGTNNAIRWTARGDIYYTRDTGRKIQGAIDNKAYSISLNAKHIESSIMLAYQRVLGNQFFDFTQETSGIFLSNAMGTDFNAPHERSVQLRYKFEGGTVEEPGLQVMIWVISGWGADASVEATTYSAASSKLHDTYWKLGNYVKGGHREFGIKTSYTIKSTVLKGVKITALFNGQNIDTYYPSKTFRDHRLMIDYPVKIF